VMVTEPWRGRVRGRRRVAYLTPFSDVVPPLLELPRKGESVCPSGMEDVREQMKDQCVPCAGHHSQHLI
jgi:hypothetical protein